MDVLSASMKEADLPMEAEATREEGEQREDVEEEEWDSDLPRLRGRSFGDIQKEVDEEIRRAVGEDEGGKPANPGEEE